MFDFCVYKIVINILVMCTQVHGADQSIQQVLNIVFVIIGLEE